jgi:hypothetical protein
MKFVTLPNSNAPLTVFFNPNEHFVSIAVMDFAASSFTCVSRTIGAFGSFTEFLGGLPRFLGTFQPFLSPFSFCGISSLAGIAVESRHTRCISDP